MHLKNHLHKLGQTADKQKFNENKVESKRLISEMQNNFAKYFKQTNK